MSRLFWISLCLLTASVVFWAGINQGFAQGQPFPELSFPLKCTFLKDCWISKYRDNDPSPGWSDYQGNNRTDNGHSGTDFLIDGLNAMHQGVSVLAVASGKVVAVRDGVD